MRRILFVLITVFLGAQTLTAGGRLELPRGSERNMNWVKRAPMSMSTAALSNISNEAALDPAAPRPIALLETNYYTFLPTEQLQLRLTVAANGFGAPVTMYLFHENRTTGERRYYNVSGGLQNAGTLTDLFGSPGAPTPIFIPTLTDFVLFGSASDTSPLSWGINGALGNSQAAGPVGLYQWG